MELKICLIFQNYVIIYNINIKFNLQQVIQNGENN